MTLEAAIPGGLSNCRPPPDPKRKPLRATSAACASAPLTPSFAASSGSLSSRWLSYQLERQPRRTPLSISIVRPVGKPSHVIPLLPRRPGAAPESYTLSFGEATGLPSRPRKGVVDE